MKDRSPKGVKAVNMAVAVDGGVVVVGDNVASSSSLYGQDLQANAQVRAAGWVRGIGC